MKLAIFDIDGTLTDTSRVDSECFAQAFADVLAINDPGVNWEDCPHVTDSGITQHVFQQRYARDPADAELKRISSRFMKLLERQHQHDAARFAEIAGATAMLWRLKQEADWVIAIATGCWQASASFKLQAAGIELNEVPAAFAEDGHAREQIVQTAIARAHEHYQQRQFEKIVSVGDGIWDVRTAGNLKLDFLGIASDERAEKLRDSGARHIIENFSDYNGFLQSLSAAMIPCAIGRHSPDNKSL